MAIPKFLLDSKGSWKGETQLHLEWLPEDKRVQTSSTFLHVETDRDHKYAKIDYIWYYEGTRQEGTMIVCGSNKTGAYEIAWSDSWHQNTAVLHCVGEVKGNSVKGKGSYKAGDQVWGWTIELLTTEKGFGVKMENVTPDGKATWAVNSTYARE
ncbi:MAG TPA: hypothetical protein VK171_05360 [Fimbriimonas sp.]|nr:hypothetical protein [Fimbriimonas sp.]